MNENKKSVIIVTNNGSVGGEEQTHNDKYNL